VLKGCFPRNWFLLWRVFSCRRNFLWSS